MINKLKNIDLYIFRLLRGNLTDQNMQLMVGNFSNLGEHGKIWFLLCGTGFVFDQNQRKQWRRATGAVAVAYGVNTALKLIVGRKRPNIDNLPPLVSTPTSLSFPSAHTTISFAAAYACSDLMSKKTLYPIAFLMAISRISLGVHYPSDVLAGALLGTIIGKIGK